MTTEHRHGHLPNGITLVVDERAEAALTFRELIAIRDDPGVLEQLRKEARRRRVDYQTLITEVLARYVWKDMV